MLQTQLSSSSSDFHLLCNVLTRAVCALVTGSCCLLMDWFMNPSQIQPMSQHFSSLAIYLFLHQACGKNKDGMLLFLLYNDLTPQCQVSAHV